MNDHLSDDALLDALEGAPGREAEAHLASCAACRDTLAEAQRALALLDDAGVPEPPAGYWGAFRDEVRARLEPRPGRIWTRAAAPLLAAAAALVVAAWLARPGTTPAPAPSAEPVLQAWSALPPAEDDESLPLLAAAAPMAEDAAWSSPPGGPLGMIAEMSDEESQALAEALRRELGREHEL